MMHRIAAVCFAVVSLTCFTGCPSLVRVTNNGPNPVALTGLPSPVEPDFEYVLPVGEKVTIDWANSPVTLYAVDKTTNKSGKLENMNIMDGGIFVATKTYIDVEWTGETLINHGSPD